MAKAIHMMIRVLDEDRSVKFYQDVLSLSVAERLDFDSFTLVYLRNDEADFEVELTVNKGQTEAYDLGAGYGHITFCVDDLDAQHAAVAVPYTHLRAHETKANIECRLLHEKKMEGERSHSTKS